MERVPALYGESSTSSNICRPTHSHQHSCTDRYVFIKFGIRRAGWRRLEFRRSLETVCSESALSVAVSVVYVHLFARWVHKERPFIILCAIYVSRCIHTYTHVHICTYVHVHFPLFLPKIYTFLQHPHTFFLELKMIRIPDNFLLDAIEFNIFVMPK